MAKRKRAKKRSSSPATRCSITRVNGKRRKICRDKKGRIKSNRAA